ncbi:phosphoadenosine phosphosulfate reductase family protein [Paracidovorax konjaci]|uniref:Phosphoadenosine phosphosulfate reductase family protein n=1 Tax=Paracidovorax konjaci TaxID=32040 RepID=A0A1I1XPZ4_9BURK|nr:phosphoadenosine phosphosulfate reductase family protein [Paracidovorax konjaci]SFE09384.1 Phosphoadenosine phosphosulfate reductase family protein [Paracidovorax konjaci]
MTAPQSLPGVLHVVSVSGGKDSLATLLLALAKCPAGSVLPIFCDTGNEHDATYAYLRYLEGTLGITIHVLRADFTEQLAAKRVFIARDVRTGREYRKVPKTDRHGNPVYLRDRSGAVRLFPVLDEAGEPTGEVQPRQAWGWDGGRKVRWTNKAKRRALSVMYPSGNPFLDLCMWKGRFPSRLAQFCTQELKRNMAVGFHLDLLEAGHKVISWQGVRRDESENRRHAKKAERVASRYWQFRPIVEWTAAQVFALAKVAGIEPNPLYLQGMSRVGCMPCINVNKAELRQIAVRFPEHPERISEWERIVGMCSKRGYSTFMTDAHAAQDRRQVFADLNVWARIEWAKTTRGGRQFDLLATLDEPTSCSSAYGLCE